MGTTPGYITVTRRWAFSLLKALLRQGVIRTAEKAAFVYGILGVDRAVVLAAE